MNEQAGSLALFVGTQKGLFIMRRRSRDGTWSLEGPHIAGYEILHAWLDRRDNKTAYAAAYHTIWGAHIYRSVDRGNTWSSLEQVPQHPKGTYEPTVKAIWCLQSGPAASPNILYAGIDPAGLFVSTDYGASWTGITGLNQHATRNTWEPARGGFSVHSICVDPLDPKRMYVAVSAGGVYRSVDAGVTWEPANRGVRAENLLQRYPEAGHNVHRLIMHPSRPARLYRQCYNGTYRSDDGTETWTEITAGLPSDFGYAIAVDPRDAETVFQIPQESSHMRTMADGKLRVYRSQNGGQSWEALTEGLPQEHVHVSVLREGMDTDGMQPCGVYFGTSSGHLFASGDAGERWSMIASFLPRILSVKAALLPTV